MVSSTIPISGFRERTPAQAQEKIKPYAWIVNPWFDTLFVFGGFLWILFGIHFLTYGWNPVDEHVPVMGAFAVSTLMVALGVFGQHIFADSHTVATYMRIYATPESRKIFKLYAYYLPWLSLSLLTLALLFREAAGIVVYVHLMWVFQHYVGQCYGIGLIYCYKRGYYLNNVEREIFRWFMHGLSIIVITRILCYREFSPYVYFETQVPFWGLPPFIAEMGQAFFIVMSVLFVGMIIRKYHRDGQLMPVPCLGVVLTVVGIGLSVGMASSMVWIYGPPFFHGSQYLAVSLGFYLKEKGIPEGMAVQHIWQEWFKPRALKYWAYTIVAGMFIYVVVPHFMMYFGFTFAMVASSIQACINFHHFVSDAAIWRLRDQRCREILIA